MKTSGRRSLIFLIYMLAFICAIGNPVAVPSLPFIMRDFALTPIEMGMVISMFALPGVCIIPLYGVLSDRIGRRPMLLAELIICVAGSLICWAAPSFGWLLAGRALQGLSITPLEAMCNTLVSDLFQGEERMRFVTKATAMQYFSIAITPIIVTWILSFGTWRTGFLFAVILGAASLLFSLPIAVPQSPSRGVNIREYGSHLRTLLTSGRVLSLFSVRIGSALVIFGAVYPHLSLLVDKGYHLSPDHAGVLFSMYAVGMFVGAMSTQWGMRHLSARMIGLVGGLELCLSMTLLLLGSGLVEAVPALFLVGMGTGMLNSCCAGHVSLTATPDTRGSIMSAYSTMFRLGQTCAPIIFGLCYQYGSFNGVFGAGLITSLLVTLAAPLSFAYADLMEHRHGDLHHT